MVIKNTKKPTGLIPPVHMGDDISFDGVRLIKRNHFYPNDLLVVYELKPQILNIQYSNKRPSVGYYRPPHRDYQIRVPYVIFTLYETTSSRGCCAFFSNGEFKSLEDKVCYACLPNVAYNGKLCWKLGRQDGQKVDSLVSSLTKQFAHFKFNNDINNIATGGILVQTKKNGTIRIPDLCRAAIPFLHKQALEGVEIIWPKRDSINSCLNYVFRSCYD